MLIIIYFRINLKAFNQLIKMPKPEMSPPTISLNEKSPRIDIPRDCITLSISQNEKQVWACSLSLQMVGWAGAAD